MDDASGRHDQRMDDGGASKGSDRLYRRKARRLLTVSVMSLLLAASVLVILQPSWSSSLSRPKLQQRIQAHARVRWVDPRQVPPIHDKFSRKQLIQWGQASDATAPEKKHHLQVYPPDALPWEDSSTDMHGSTPTLDYTQHDYIYPEPAWIPPPFTQYPPLLPLQDILHTWPQDEYDHPPTPFRERLFHFDYNNPQHLQAAIRFRDLELPFKVYNVPELITAGNKWTLEYLSSHFDSDKDKETTPNKVSGYCEESEDNFFGFYVREAWKQNVAGPYPTSHNNLSFKRFYTHAVYADRTRLPPHQKHFYWQAGVPLEERHEPTSKWSFISLDLPSFSSPNPTFFGFNPEEQKGIQCRFGERGVVAATHYDAGRNMVAMITGAKRYILSPPNQCSKLGILTDPNMGGYRHSYINFGHLSLLQDPTMPKHEREWLNLAKDSLAIDTVLKAGEVLYIPSHWFHYIISLQRSAQCNTRSGREVHGNPYFGGMAEVETCQ